jgi:hypothetical protein
MILCNGDVESFHLSCVLGEFLVLVPSHSPHLRLLRFDYGHSVCDKYIEELVAAVPELKIIK